MTEITLSSITLILVLVIFLPISSYLILREFRASRRAIEIFDDHGVELAKIAVEAWQVPRILKRTEKIGWQLESKDQTPLGQILLTLRKSGDDAASAKQLFHRLSQSGFTYRPVRQDICIDECQDNAKTH